PAVPLGKLPDSRALNRAAPVSCMQRRASNRTVRADARARLKISSSSRLQAAGWADNECRVSRFWHDTIRYNQKHMQPTPVDEKKGNEARRYGLNELRTLYASHPHTRR